ncbi:MAG: hypothetical protein WAV47_21940 [Blastocatellia bacterium]
MRKLTPPVLFICGVTFALFSVQCVRAQNAEDSELIQLFLSRLDDCNRTIAGWEFEAKLLIFLTILVAVLGLITGALQKSTSPRCKSATVAAGILISVITIITTTAFESDHRTLRRSANQARKLHAKVLEKITELRTISDPKDRQKSIELIQNYLSEIFDVRDKILTGANEPYRGLFELGTTVQAQSGQPDWISKSQSEKFNIFFTGISENTSLKEAQETSFKNALNQAIAQLYGKAGYDIDAIGNAVSQSAEVAETNFSFNPDTKKYKFYTLLKLNRTFADPAFIRAIAIGPGKPIKSSDGNKDKWEITRPNVVQAITDYPEITFRAGDRVVVDAGGCVQTGGAGRTWKRYVDPRGPGADRLYHGLISIPGATKGLVRIASVIGKPLNVSSLPSSQNFLRLGYEDDNFGDNGYWRPDDGVDDQCKGAGAAYIKLTISRQSARR